MTTIGNKKQDGEKAGGKKGKAVKAPAGGGLLARAGKTAAARTKQTTAPKERVNYVGLAKKYFQGVLAELKRVHWPGFREVAVYTVVVLITVGALAILMWVFDTVLGYVFHFVTKT